MASHRKGRVSPVKRSQENIQAAFDHLGIRVSYEKFSRRYFVEGLVSERLELDDKAMRSVFLRVDALGQKCTKDYMIDVVCDVAEHHSTHEVQDYFDGLKWDGTPRLDALLTNYCGAEDNEFSRTVGRIFLIAAVRRIRVPGIKYDNLLILEGRQGCGKSSFAQILAGADWFTDCVRLGDDPKIIAEQTAGKLIVELAELVGLSKRESETVKSMLSRQNDRARMAYGRSTTHFPRQFVFIGTTNAEEYLIDPSGNRRFWSVQVQEIDLAALARDRDQLWAEAVHFEAQGESIVLPKHLWEFAETVQTSRRRVDPIEERLADLTSDIFGIIPQEVLFEAIGVGGDRVAGRSYRHADIVTRVMADAGWKQKRIRKSGQVSVAAAKNDNRMQVYQRDNPSGENAGAWWTYDEISLCFKPDSNIR